MQSKIILYFEEKASLWSADMRINISRTPDPMEWWETLAWYDSLRARDGCVHHDKGEVEANWSLSNFNDHEQGIVGRGWREEK